MPKRRYAFGYDDQTNVSAVSVYDAAGTTITSTTCLVHDGLNRLVAVGPAKAIAGPDATACRTEADVASVQVRFQYDDQNRRTARQDGAGAWKQYVPGLDGNPLSELTRPTTSGGAWAPVRDYVWVDGQAVAQLEYPGPQVYALHVDHLGLPRAMTSGSQATVWSAATRPYGDLEETTTGVVTNLRLPGQYDERLFAAAGISGLQGPYYNWNRWYLPGVGRYLEADPIATAGGFNTWYGVAWYSYSGGNPLRNTDPDGQVSLVPMPGDPFWNYFFGPPRCEIPPDPCKDAPPDWLPDWTPIKQGFNKRCGNKKNTCRPCACVFADGSITIMNWSPPKNEFECKAECTMPQPGKPPAVAYRCSGVTMPINVPPN